MQRLSSNFPGGKPALALLMLRLALATMLLNGATNVFLRLGWPGTALATVAVALLLGVGLLTPAMAALCIVLKLGMGAASPAGVGTVHVCALLVALALAMLGPGAYSLDARLFGRRKVVIPEFKRSEKD